MTPPLPNHDEALVDRELITKIGGFGGSNLAVEIGPDDTVFTAYGATIYTLDASEPGDIQIRGSFLLSDKVWDLRYAEGLLFVANLHHGLAVLDASNPHDLRFRGRLDTAGQLRRLFVRGEWAYLADGFGGLRIADVSDPRRPREKARHLCGGRNVRAVYVHQRHAYVAVAESPSPPAQQRVEGGLCVFDVQEPTKPKLQSFTPTHTGGNSARADDVFVAGDFAYLAARGSGVAIVNVADPLNPDVSSHWVDPSCVHPFSANTLTMARGHVIAGLTAPGVAERRPGAIIKGDAAAPPVVTSRGCAPTAHDDPWVVRAKGQRAYVAHDDAGLRVVDLATMESFGRPFIASSVVYDVAVEQDTAYVADYFTGLSIVDVQQLTEPHLVSTWHRPEYDEARPAKDTWARITVRDGIVLLSRTTDGVYLIDAREREAPAMRHSFPRLPLIADASLGDGFICVAEVHEEPPEPPRTRIVKFDITDLSNPQEVGHCFVERVARVLFLDGTLLYVAIQDGRLEVVDVSDSELKVVRSTGIDGMALDVVVSEGLAAVALNRGDALVIDATADSLPVLGRTPIYGEVGQPPNQFGAKSRAVWLHDSRLYVGYSDSDLASGVRVFDVSTPATPTLIAQYDPGRSVGGGGATMFGLQARDSQQANKRELFAAVGDAGFWILLEGAP